MSKYITLTPEFIKECAKEFEESLLKAKIADGKISFNKTIGAISRRAKLYFSDMAWTKMQSLVREFEKEVAWHGVATRGEDESKDEYYITDILVYPQEVSGASVEMDVAKYDEWIRENADDERFYRIGMQGHSHVRMGVSPSSVDLAHQEAILNQLTDDMFYIFVIWNKHGDKNIKIYDLAKNVLFETSDIEVEIMNDGYALSEFIAKSKDMVKERTVGYKFPQTNYSAGFNSTSSASKPAPPHVININDDKKEDKKEENTAGRKGKRKGKKGNKKQSRQSDDNTSSYRQGMLYGIDDDWCGYDDYPYYR